MSPLSMLPSGSPQTISPSRVVRRFEYLVLELESTAVSKMSMLALAMSFTATRPRRLPPWSTTQSVPVLVSRMRFQAA